MKIKVLFYSLMLLLVASTTSCSNDWITVNPTGETSESLIYDTTDNLYLAVNGLGKLTVKQYLSSQGFNGEGTIKLYYGEYTGNNFVRDLSSWATVMNFQYYATTTSTYDYFPFYYYYRIIGDANAILDNVDAAIGSDADKAEIKARVLSYRAHSYLMLSQLYCGRWSDSNGSGAGLPIKLSAQDPDDTPLSTLAEVYQQIYTDLDDAIANFSASGISNSNFYDMSLSAAYAIYARAALTREDFDTAARMAVLARNGHALMSNTELLAGFCEDNNEWIWGSVGVSSETIYYYSYQAYLGYNANSSVIRNYPCSITRELFYQIPETDIRRSWWYDPQDENTIPEEIVVKTLNKEDFSSDEAYNQAVDAEKARVAALKESIKAQAAYGSTMTSTHKFYNYMQLKIAAREQVGVGDMPHYRTSEMYLIEAEALARKSSPDYAGAQAALIALNATSGRDASFTTAKTGTDLVEEIWLYRAIELWGEGFDWFDLKRTGRSINRSAKGTNADGSKILGSYLSTLAISYGPTDRNNWTWSIPDKETDYNTLID